jgi:hypothetical protein
MTEKSSNWPQNAREGMMMLDAERSGLPFLYWRDGDQQLQFLMLAGDRSPLTVGRRETAGVPLPWDDQVSRLHATLELVGEDSTNGTWISGSRVDGRKRLHRKDHIHFGMTRVDYHGPGDGTVPTTTRTPQSPHRIELTERKRRVLIALCRPVFVEGARTPATNPQIAEELHVTVDTVKGTLKELFDQFGLGSLPQNEKRSRLVAIVRDYRLLAPHDF